MAPIRNRGRKDRTGRDPGRVDEETLRGVQSPRLQEAGRAASRLTSTARPPTALPYSAIAAVKLQRSQSGRDHLGVVIRLGARAAAGLEVGVILPRYHIGSYASDYGNMVPFLVRRTMLAALRCLSSRLPRSWWSNRPAETPSTRTSVFVLGARLAALSDARPLSRSLAPMFPKP